MSSPLPQESHKARYHAPVLLDFESDEPFRYGFDPDDPVVHFGDAELGGLPRDVSRIRGCLLLAIPLQRDTRKRAFAASWPYTWERS